jgi:hypothetical protein
VKFVLNVSGKTLIIEVSFMILQTLVSYLSLVLILGMVGIRGQYLRMVYEVSRVRLVYSD